MTAKTRREFLRSSVVMATTLLVAACQPKVVEKLATKEVEKEVTKIVKEEVQVEKEVTRIVEKEVEKEKIVEVDLAREQWLTGQHAKDYKSEVNFFSWEDEGEMRKFLLAIDRFFQNFYPNVKYDIEWGVPWNDYWTKLPTLIAGGTPPDLCWHQGPRLPMYVEKGWMLEIDDYLDVAPPGGWPDDWWPVTRDRMYYKGHWYGLPYDYCTTAAYVNRDIMDPIVGDYPVPDDWTYDDMRNLAGQATKELPDGKMQFGVQWDIGTGSWWRITRANGGRIWADEPEYTTTEHFTNDIAVEAAQWLWDLRWKDRVMPTPGQEEGLQMAGEFGFGSGLVAMDRSINDVTFRFNEIIGDRFAWGVYPVPKGKDRRVGAGGGSCWSIPKGTSEPDIMYECMSYCLSNPDILPTTATMGSAFPGRKSFAKWGCPTGELAEMIPNYKEAFLELGAGTETELMWPGMQEYNDLWQKNMGPCYDSGKENVYESLVNFQKDVQELLDGAWWMN